MKRKRSIVTSRRPASRSLAPPMSTRPARRPGTPSTDPREARPATREARPATPRTSALPARTVDLSVDLAPDRPGGLRLAHPLLVAAGGAGYGIELLAASLAPPAAIVTRGTSLRAHGGAEPPRMVATRAGLVSAIGSQNPGVARVIEMYGARWAASDVPIVLALCADDRGGFAALARATDAQPGIAGLELHLGCRDLRRARRVGADPSHDPDAVAAIVRAVRAESSLPVIAKLGGTAPDAGEVAVAAVEAGADAICAIDAMPALAIDRVGHRPALGAGGGRLSGPALTPIALGVVQQVARAVRVPIVGVGGVATLDDVLDMLMAGASAVGMATAALADPGLPGRLAQALEAWCRAEAVESPREIVGTASQRRAARRRA
jgi:dihydroorotate dehydrogenase (NAD+) catalytic subunit